MFWHAMSSRAMSIPSVNITVTQLASSDARASAAVWAASSAGTGRPSVDAGLYAPCNPGESRRLLRPVSMDVI